MKRVSLVALLLLTSCSDRCTMNNTVTTTPVTVSFAPAITSTLEYGSLDNKLGDLTVMPDGNPVEQIDVDFNTSGCTPDLHTQATFTMVSKRVTLRTPIKTTAGQQLVIPVYADGPSVAGCDADGARVLYGEVRATIGGKEYIAKQEGAPEFRLVVQPAGARIDVLASQLAQDVQQWQQPGAKAVRLLNLQLKAAPDEGFTLMKVEITGISGIENPALFSTADNVQRATAMQNIVFDNIAAFSVPQGASAGVFLQGDIKDLHHDAAITVVVTYKGEKSGVIRRFTASYPL